MTDLTLKQIQSEKGIRWVYGWLLISPLVTVPCMVISFPYSDSTNAWSWMMATIIPLIFHAVLLIGAFSPYRYVSRHAQQAIALILFRTLSSMYFIGLWHDVGVFFWLVANGGLWIFSTAMGLYQVYTGDCLLMRLLGEGGELPRPWAKKGFTVTAQPLSAQPAPLAPVVAASAPVVSSPPLVAVPTSESPVAPSPKKIVPAHITSTSASASSNPTQSKPEPLSVPASSLPTVSSPQPSLIESQRAALIRGKNLTQQGQYPEAIQCFLTVFRITTNAEIKKEAVEALKKLGQVGIF